LFEYFVIFDQNLVKFEQTSFLEILESLKKAFFLNYSFEKIKLEAYESLIEKLIKAIHILQNNKSLVGLNKDYKTSFDELSVSLNENFLILYKKEIQKNSNLNSLNFQKIYTIYVQFFSLLKYNNLSNTIFVISDSMFFLIKILNHCSQNYKSLVQNSQNDIFERLLITCLNLGNEIIYNDFNKYVNMSTKINLEFSMNNSKVKEYVNNRTNFFQFIYNLIQMPDDQDKQLYFSMLRIKSRGICILFEIYIYSTSEKLKEIPSFSDLYYSIPNLLRSLMRV
jgi:hypothetical protein